MKIALFLGAGASVPYGMPTTKELRDGIKYGNMDFPRKDLLDYGRFPDIEHILSILDELITFADSRAGQLYAESGGDDSDDVSSGPPRNIFSTRRIRKDRDHTISAVTFKTYVDHSHKSKEIIEQLITESYKWNSRNNSRLVQILRPFLDLARSEEEHVTIFTTNYDTAIEAYCGSTTRKTECVDGFKLHTAKRIPVWDGKFLPRNEKYYKKVILYKLHGSMNWLADKSGGRGRIVHKPDTHASNDRARDMYIRPSFDTKDEAEQKEPYATILREFRQALPKFDMCIVIGYSFRDRHISEELVKFAKSGGILFLIDPRATTNFQKYALEEGSPDRKKKWRAKDGLYRMPLVSRNRTGIVYALNEKLATDSVNDIIGVIKQLIKKITPSRKTAVGNR